MKIAAYNALVMVMACSCLHAAEPHVIQLDPDSPGRMYEGVGAVSAGASSRLLIDYPEPQRSQILDFLFKPGFGASFQHLKVEIGGGENSTCGSEPSHVLNREELIKPISRGYEFWLMAEARKRNPDIILDCLPWAYPSWIKDRFSQDASDWFVSFLETARKQHQVEINWISAAQNEMGSNLEWIRDSLRPTLDARGFSHVKLQAPDDDEDFWKIFDKLEKDEQLDKLIAAVGYHYVDGRKPWKIDQQGKREATQKAKDSGKPLWASEEWSQSGKTWDDKGALYLARLINKVYIRDRITKYQIWSPIDSIYSQLAWSDTGAMQADTPWSGHYTVWPAIWAIAHTTQFASPGWHYLDSACSQITRDTWRGSHVALIDPKTKDWSVVITTGEPRRIRLELKNGMKSGPIHAWMSCAKEQFMQLNPLTPHDGAVELDLQADAIYTFTSATGQTKGTHGKPPSDKPFPLPYSENFDDTLIHQSPRFFSDQKGTFEVLKCEQGSCLTQVAPAEGIIWLGNRLLKPHTLFGDAKWSDIAIEVEVLITEGDVEIGGRYARRDKLGYRWILNASGQWNLNWQETNLAKGQLANFEKSNWQHLKLEMVGDQIHGWINGQKLCAVTDSSGKQGMAFLASSYHRNFFDKVKVTPAKQ